jgi:hypothetical protein
VRTSQQFEFDLFEFCLSALFASTPPLRFNMSFPSECSVCICPVRPTAADWSRHEGGKAHRKKLSKLYAFASISNTATSVSHPASASSSALSVPVASACLDTPASSPSPRSNPRTPHSLTHNDTTIYPIRESRVYSEASIPNRSYSHAQAPVQSSQPPATTLSNIVTLIHPTDTACTTDSLSTSPQSTSNSANLSEFCALSPLTSEFNPILDLPPRHLIDWKRVSSLSHRNAANNFGDVARLVNAAYYTLSEYRAVSASLVTFDPAYYPKWFDFTAYAILIALCFQSDFRHVIFTLQQLQSKFSIATSSSTAAVTSSSVTVSSRVSSSESCVGLIAPCRMFNLFRPCTHTQYYCPVCDVDLYGKRDFIVHLKHRRHARQLADWNERERLAAMRQKADTLNARFTSIIYDEPMPVEHDAGMYTWDDLRSAMHEDTGSDGFADCVGDGIPSGHGDDIFDFEDELDDGLDDDDD